MSDFVEIVIDVVCSMQAERDIYKKGWRCNNAFLVDCMDVGCFLA